MRSPFLIFFLLLLGVLPAGRAAAADIEAGPMSICRLGRVAPVCEPAGLDNTTLRDAPEHLLRREVMVAPEAVRSDRPLMVVLVAMAASEVRWNGEIIGRNGRPGPDRMSETPGRLVAVFVVPPELVKPGANEVTARLSSHHLPLPVRNAVHLMEVGDYVDPMRVGLMAYLPALLMIGVLAVAAVYFTAAALLDRGRPGAGLLAAIAWLTLAQLAVEISRVFVNYLYPWHVARVAAIAALAGVTAVLVAAWAAKRFRTPRPWLVTGAAAALAAAAITLHPSYDGKAGWAVAAGFAVFTACVGYGVYRRVSGGRVALALGLGAIGVWVWQDGQFLDRGYYLLMAAVMAALVAAEVLALRRVRAEGGREAERADALERALARRDDAVARIRDGARVHVVPVADILMLQAADDYCEVRMVDGRSLLSTASLARTLAGLPGDFVRVHKSFAVNAAHVTTIGPRPGGRRAVSLSDGSSAPVGRAYETALGRWTVMAEPAQAAS